MPPHAPYTYAFGAPPWHAGDDPHYGSPAGVVGSIDLRTLPDMSISGEPRMGCFYAFGNGATVGEEFVVLGEGDLRELSTTSLMQDAWQSATGYRPSGDTLNDLLFDHLTSGADPEGQERCKPLMPTRRLNLDVHLGGHSLINRSKFRLGQHAHSAKVKAMLQRQLLDVRAESHDGKLQRPIVEGKRVVSREIDHEYHRRIATAICEKYRIADFESIRPKGWDRRETLLPHDTAVTDDFNRVDQALNALGTWTEVEQSTAIVGNQVRSDASANVINRARFDTDLSTVDHYVQCVCTSYSSANAGRFVGVCGRYSSSADTCYAARWRNNATSSRGVLLRIVANVSTGLVTGLAGVAGTPFTARVECDGSTISAYQSGTLINQVTDTGIATGLRGGIYVNEVASTYSFVDDFEAGDLDVSAPSIAAHAQYYRRMRMM